MPKRNSKAPKTTDLAAFGIKSIIPKPTGVDEILKEIQQSTAVTMYYDSQRQEFRLKGINGLNFGQNVETQIPITDDMIIAKSAQIKDDPSASLTRVLLFSQLRDPTDFGKKAKDWKNISLYVDTAGNENENARGEKKQFTLYSRWLSSTQSGSVSSVYLREGRINTSQFTFKMPLLPDGGLPVEIGEIYEYQGSLSSGFYGEIEIYAFRVLEVQVLDYRTAKVVATRSSTLPSGITAFRLGISRYGSDDVLI